MPLYHQYHNAFMTPLSLSRLSNGPLEGGVLGRSGGSRSERKGQPRPIQCLYAIFLVMAEILILQRLRTLSNNPLMLDTQLADRTGHTATTSQSTQQQQQQQQPAQRTVSSPPTSSKKQTQADSDLSLQNALTATRADLSDAQRSRAELQEKLARVSAELEKLRKKGAQDTRRISALDGERTHSQLRLKDRDEELRGKAKLLEVWSFTITLHMSPLPLTHRPNRISKTKWQR